MFLYC